MHWSRLAWIAVLFGLAPPALAITHVTTTSLAASGTWGPTGTVVDTEFWIEPSTGTTFTIPTGVTLTVQSGTTVRVKGGVSFILNGSLTATSTLFGVTPGFTEWGSIQMGSSGTISLGGCTIRDFGNCPVWGTIAQVSSLFATNSFIARPDDKFNAILLRSSTVASNVTLSAPPPEFCYLTEAGSTLEVRGVSNPFLIIATGTTIKFGSGSLLRLGLPTLAGGLVATGVVFTSAADDTIGDSTGDGATSGAPGQWRNIRFDDNSLDMWSELNGCQIRYGGGSGDGYGLLVQDAQPQIVGCVIRDNQGFGLLLAGSSTAEEISGNLLRDNRSMEFSAPPWAVANVFQQNDVELSDDGKFDGYHVRGGTISESLSLPVPNPGFCYYAAEGAVLDVGGANQPVLTLAPGSIWKMGAGSQIQVGLLAPGALHAEDVVFTSSRDDVLSDTNGDGAATTGAPGQWQSMRFHGDTVDASSTLDGCEIRFAGGPNGEYGISVQDAQPTIVNCVIRDNFGFGLRLLGRSTGAEITGNTLEDNTGMEFSAPPQAVANLFQQNDVVLSDDGRFNGYHVRGDTISANLTLPAPRPGFCYYLGIGASLDVRGASGPVLTLAQGSLWKMSPSSLIRVGATLSGGLHAKGVVFTSSADDSLGDTNGDGPSVGAPGHWRNIRFDENALDGPLSTLDGCEIRYAGDSQDHDGYAVRVLSAEPTVVNCVIRDNLGFGLLVEGSSTGTGITGSLLKDNTSFEIATWNLGVASRLVANNTILLSRDGRFNGYFVSSGTLSGTIHLTRPPERMVYYLASSLDIPASAALHVPSGCVFKLFSGTRLLVQGTLTVHGKVDQDPIAPVVFTSSLDDSWWGDTDGNGPSVGSPASWQRIELAGANSSVLDGCIFSFGGAGGLGQVYVNATGPQALPNVTIKNSHFYLAAGETGIRLLNSNARVDSCSFLGSSAMKGVNNLTPGLTVVASNSWWGHATGPFDPLGGDFCTNPGGLGVGVSDYVNYCPFLTSQAPVTDAPPIAGPTDMGIAWVGPVPARSELSVMLGNAPGGSGTLEFLDPSGRIVRRMATLADGAGRNIVRWDLRDDSGQKVPPGVYFARYRYTGRTQTRRIVLTR